MNPTSGVISEAFDLYKKHFTHLFLTAFVIYLGVAVVTALLVEIGGLLGALVSALVSIIGLFLLEAALVEAVSDIRDGRADMSVGQTLSRGFSHVGPVAGASILAGLGVVIGLALLIVPGLILLTIWSVIVPVIVLERTGALASFSRSQQLVKGYGMNVFGVIALTFLILIGLGILLGVVLSPLPDRVAAFISNVVSGSLTGPITALVATLLYFRLKAAKEGGAPSTSPAAPSPPPSSPSF